MPTLAINRLYQTRCTLLANRSRQWPCLNHSRRFFSSTLRNDKQQPSPSTRRDRFVFNATRKKVIASPKLYYGDINFNENDIPPFSYFAEQAKYSLPDPRWEPGTIRLVATKYVSSVMRSEEFWQTKMGGSISPELLHQTAIYMRLSGTERGIAIARHMLVTGVTLSYAPSILTVARQELAMGESHPKATFSRMPEFWEEFERLILSDDPNAHTLKGLRLSGKYPKEAIKFLRHAAAIGGDKRGAWEWQDECSLTRAKVCMKLGELQEAHDVLQHAAMTLNNPIAKYLWVLIFFFRDQVPVSEQRPLMRLDIKNAPTPPADVDPVELLQSAAMNNFGYVARLLAWVERRKSEDEALSERERQISLVLAGEWQALGRRRGPKDKEVIS